MMWHRADGQLEIKRPFLYPTPVLREDLRGYLSYPVTNTEIAISLAVMATRDKKHTDYPERHMKQACWFVKFLCEYTDIVEHGVAIGLGITTDMREIAMPYLEACQFPLDRIHWFKSQEDTYQYISKFIAMQHPDVRDCRRILHLDNTLWLGNHPTQRNLPLIKRVLDVWTDQPLAVDRLFKARNGYKMSAMEWAWDDELDHEHNLPVWEAAAKLAGNTPEEEFNYWRTHDPMYYIEDGIWGVTPALIKDLQFGEVVRQISPYKLDTAYLSMYCRLQGWTEDDVAILREVIPGVDGMPGDVPPLYTVRGLDYSWIGTDMDTWLRQYKL